MLFGDSFIHNPKGTAEDDVGICGRRIQEAVSFNMVWDTADAQDKSAEKVCNRH